VIETDGKVPREIANEIAEGLGLSINVSAFQLPEKASRPSVGRGMRDGLNAV